MKKKIIILLSVVIILLMGIVVSFNIPLDLMDLDPNEVMEIVVFNGNSGKRNTYYRQRADSAYCRKFEWRRSKAVKAIFGIYGI